MKPTEQDDKRIAEITEDLFAMKKLVDGGYKMNKTDFETVEKLSLELREINERNSDLIDEQIASVMGKSQRESDPIKYWFWYAWVSMKQYGLNWIKLLFVSFLSLTIGVYVVKLAVMWVKLIW